MASISAMLIHPEACFVIKSVLEPVESSSWNRGKCFINVCVDEKVPCVDPSLLTTAESAATCKVAIAVSAMRQELDNKALEAYVWDCCVHPRLTLHASVNADIRGILIEMCLERIEDITGARVDRGYSLPKILYKGTPKAYHVDEKLLYSGASEDLSTHNTILLPGSRNAEMSVSSKRLNALDPEFPVFRQNALEEREPATSTTAPSMLIKELGGKPGPSFSKVSSRKFQCHIIVYNVSSSSRLYRTDNAVLVEDADRKLEIPFPANTVKALFTQDTQVLHLFG